MSKRTITVSGLGHAAVTPDVVRLDLRIGHDAPDVAAALAGAAAGLARVGQVVRDQGVVDSDIRTLDANVSQRYDNTGAPIGFTAQQRLGVTVRRIDTVGQILEAAAAGVGNALLVDQVRLDVADRSEGLARARELAFRDAKAKAEQYAALSGSRLGNVLGVAESGITPLLAPRGPAYAARELAAGMPIEGGDLDLSATVTVAWELS